MERNAGPADATGPALFQDTRLPKTRIAVIWHAPRVIASIGGNGKSFRSRPGNSLTTVIPHQECAMISERPSMDGFEISSRFRLTIEERVARLERDASSDEALLARLENDDHRRRQMRLVAVQRSEALRMRLFLERTQMRLAKPQIAPHRD